VPASALCSSSKRIIGQTKRVIEQTNWSIANGRTFFLRERPTCGGCSLGLYRLERVSLLGGHRFLLRSLSNECDRRSGRHALGRGRLCGRRRQRPLSRLASTTGTLLLLGLRPAGSRARRHGTRVGKELLADPWRIAEITSGPRRCSGRRRDKCWPAQAWHHGAPAGEVAGAGLKVWWRRGRSRGIASEQGLKSGDVIRELGDLKVVTPEEVRKAMGEAQKEIASMPRGGYAAHADETPTI